MDQILDKLIIKDIKNIIYSYLSKSHKIILKINNNNEDFDMEDLIKYDSEIMIYAIEEKYKYNQNKLFKICAKNGKLENMKWLFENKFPYDTGTFAHASRNGNFNNMKWLLENKFPYGENTKSKLIELGLFN